MQANAAEGSPNREHSRVHGVLVTYRRPDDLAVTLQALARQTRQLDSLVVVDNDPARSARSIVGEALGAEYVAAGDNLGPAGGLQLGVSRVILDADDNDWIVFLDDDDPPESDDQVRSLLAFAEASRAKVRRLGAVGLVGARYDRRRGRIHRVPDDELSGLVRVDYIGGGQFPLYSAAAVRSVGVPRADLFFGFDDLEFGLQLRAAGWDLVTDGDTWRTLRDSHARMGLTSADLRSRNALPPWRAYYSTRNQIVIARAHGTRLAPWFSVVLAVGRVARSATQRSRWPTTRAMSRGLVDGMLSRVGRRMTPT